ncbi:MAG: Hsp33 family molecular chaperone HslO [Clostridia bacterium]|nr:Hsp33 family molecular chaperone HslO [Clostridia bacterium]
MNNLVRTLIYNGQVSLTVADTTEMVAEGIRLHTLSPLSARVFGKALSAMTFMSSCLKEETGEISLALACDGACGGISVSGNRKLFLRGYVENTSLEGESNDENERKCLGNECSITIIRDDGYSRPFVGACVLPENAGLDEGFEEYFRISEQLPTRITTLVEFDEKNECVFAGVIALQPLPFADKSVLESVANTPLQTLLQDMKKIGIPRLLRSAFTIDEMTFEEREAVYKCNCSREYLTRVLISLGEEQLREIIREDGAARIHCHYCNTDYEFTDEDANKIFKRTE